MRLELKCPFCGNLLCKMKKDSEIELYCRHCKAVLLIGLIELPIEKYRVIDTS